MGPQTIPRETANRRLDGNRERRVNFQKKSNNCNLAEEAENRNHEEVLDLRVPPSAAVLQFTVFSNIYGKKNETTSLPCLKLLT